MKAKNYFSLDGKVTLVTGGYGHLGKAMVIGLSQAGATTLVGARYISKFRQAFSIQPKPNISFVKLDISSSNSIKSAFKKVYQEQGSFDVLVNNGFYLRGNSPENMTDKDWKYGLDGTLNSVFRCMREVLPYMKKSGGGKIINIASQYGVTAPDFKIYQNKPQFLNPPHYGTAKAGVIQLTKYYASYLARYNIRVNCISPGAFPSSTVQRDKKFIKILANKIPLGRIGQPEELAGAITFLASDAASYITGHNLIIDGGWTTQ